MSNFWEKLSVREQRLALTTSGLIIAMLCMAIGYRAVGRIQELDRTVNHLEQDLINYSTQNACAKSVDKAFVDVAKENSSAWTENEIFNRLRQEIYRLAQENPDAPSSGKNLVEIPTLRQGTLKETGLGSREYQLNIKLVPTDVYSVIMFCVRLQSSPQTLRIDRLEIARAPDSQQVTATIDVTRVVVAGNPTEAPTENAEEGGDTGTTPASAPVAPPPPQEDVVAHWDGSQVDNWHGQGCDMSIVDSVADKAASGGSCLKIAASADEGHAFMTQELEPGASFELGIDATATGGAALGIMDESTGQMFEGAQDLTSDGGTYRYHIRFTVPPNANKSIKISAPYITLKGKDAVVYVDNLEIKKL